MVTVYWPFSKISVDVKQVDNELSKENMLIIENIFRSSKIPENKYSGIIYVD